MDKLSKHPLEEDTSASALQERYNYYDEIEYETAYFEADGVTKKKSKHLKLVSRVVSVGDLMEEYRKKLAYYVYHINYVRMSHAVRLERLGFSPGEVSLIMDYSEKLNKTQREAAHSQYWDSVTLTLEVAVAEYYKASLSDADRARLAASLVGVDREKQHAHLGITLDQMNEVTSHGKDEADGHGGVIKTWLTNEMRRVELDKGEAPEGGAHEQAAPREVEHREPRVPHLPRSTRG